MNLGQRFWSFWEEAEFLPLRLATFRVLFFGLLGFDMWLLMVPHASRYGAGALNVAHFEWLNGTLPLPTPDIISLLYVVGGFLSLRIAAGVARHMSVLLLTGIYNLCYYWSQADSYQHHYLIGLILLLTCFIPFSRLEREERPVACWAAKLLYALVAIVYFYTAVTKLSPYWLDGSTISAIAQDEMVRAWQHRLGLAVGWSEQTTWAFAAHAVMVWQFLAAGSFLWKKLRPVACISGPIFHILVELLGLKIGWFSYYMIAIYYILLFPDRWFSFIAAPFIWLCERIRPWWDRSTGWSKKNSPGIRLVCTLVCGVLCGWVTSRLPFEATAGIVLAVAVLAVAGTWRSTRPLLAGIAQLSITIALLLSLSISDVVYDYYRFWAGDSARRGNLAEAASLYEHANALQPFEEARRPKLIRIYKRLGRSEDAIRVEEELKALRLPR